MVAQAGARKRALRWYAGFALSFIVPPIAFELLAARMHSHILLLALLLIPLLAGQRLQAKGGPRSYRERVASDSRNRRINLAYASLCAALTVLGVVVLVLAPGDWLVTLPVIVLFGLGTWILLKEADYYR